MVVGKEFEVELVELKGHGELCVDLVNHIEEL